MRRIETAALLLALVGGLPVTSQAVAGRLVETTRIVNGVPLTIRRDPDRSPAGQYLVTVNNVYSMMEARPPLSALLLAVGGDGKIDVVSAIRSRERIWGIDLKALPDGNWTFALNRPDKTAWVYDMRLIDPVSREEVVPPSTYPTRDRELDGHETVVFDGDRRLFLFYRKRAENGQTYFDMEVQAIAASDGRVAGKWSSKGLFPDSMTGDYLHFNGLFPLGDGRVLASSRSTDTLFVLNLDSGRIDDRIDAKTWTVLDDPKGGFARQHFAHFRANGNLVLYDNRDEGETAPRSRAVEYAVDWKARTLRLVWQQEVEAGVPFRYGWGSVAVTERDDVVIGWGDYPRTKGYCEGRSDTQPVFSHVTRQHEVIFEMRAPCGWHTYRAYLVPATPRPTGVAR